MMQKQTLTMKSDDLLDAVVHTPSVSEELPDFAAAVRITLQLFFTSATQLMQLNEVIFKHSTAHCVLLNLFYFILIVNSDIELSAMTQMFSAHVAADILLGFLQKYCGQICV